MFEDHLEFNINITKHLGRKKEARRKGEKFSNEKRNEKLKNVFDEATGG